MPYCAIVLSQEDDPYGDTKDLQLLESGMTVGLGTAEQMEQFIDMSVSGSNYWVRILDMTIEKVSSDHNFVAMPQQPTIGRRVVKKYFVGDNGEKRVVS